MGDKRDGGEVEVTVLLLEQAIEEVSGPGWGGGDHGHGGGGGEGKEEVATGGGQRR